MKLLICDPTQKDAIEMMRDAGIEVPDAPVRMPAERPRDRVSRALDLVSAQARENVLGSGVYLVRLESGGACAAALRRREVVPG